MNITVTAPGSPFGTASTRPNAVASLRALSETAPQAPVLLHKRGGVWRLFRRWEALREVERLAALLRTQGLGSGSRLAICGALEPDLLFVALAVEETGATLHPVSRAAHGAELVTALAEIDPTHAFVQGRRTITRWLAVAPPGEGVVPLFTDLDLAPHPGRWRLHGLAPQTPEEPRNGRTADLRDRLRGLAIAWSDEGSEWPEGIDAANAFWLSQRGIVAFPEAPESSARDRREILPTDLLVSDARRREIAEEFDRRLAPVGSLRRRLTEEADAASPGFFGRLLRTRIDRIFGLPRDL